MLTHEQFIAEVARLATSRANLTTDEYARYRSIKLAYGYGPGGALGITYHKAWQRDGSCLEEAVPFVEICAGHERSIAELATTVIHELGHVVLGPGHGHDKPWKEACQRLGLRLPRAYASPVMHGWAYLTPDIRLAIATLGRPQDGKALAPSAILGPRGGKIRPCGTGIGTRGGKSRGPGSGSRSIKVQCPTCQYTARVTRKWLDLGAPICPRDMRTMVE